MLNSLKEITSMEKITKSKILDLKKVWAYLKILKII
jgi:hypothetical protein